jgi:quercetin dioxygenase-like cupin family protein
MAADEQLKAQGPRGVAYDAPTLIKAADAKRFLWGDDAAGYVSDWIYGSSPNIHMMSFSMNVGSRFGNSADFKTYYNCHETYYCLKGEFTFHCPETGEVHLLRKGDCLHFPPDTWHWGYNFGSEECRILESLTPRLESHIEAYAKAQPWLETIHLVEPGRIHDYLPGKSPSAARATLIRPEQALREIVGQTRPMRVDILCSTAALTTATIDLYSRQQSEVVSHPGDKVLYALEGQTNVFIPGGEGIWWEMNPGDTAFIPAGTGHAFFNTSDAMAKILFSTAPAYR